MSNLPMKALLGAGCFSLALASVAHAGGFNRGTADTDILFEEGNFNVRAGATVVAPQRKYEKMTAPAGAALGGLTPGASYSSSDGKYSETYIVPSFAVKFNIANDLRCAGTYTEPYGAGSEYGPMAIAFGGYADGTGTVREGFKTTELGATCGYKFDLAKGRAWLIGGVFMEDFEYSQTVRFNGAVLAAGGVDPALAGALNGTDATLAFNGNYNPGFRIGAAYEIPEIALRAQIMYRSKVEHNPDGQFTSILDGLFLGGAPAPAVATGTTPQSVEFKLQSGIAPGWLAFGSVKWTDWSVLQTLDYTISGLPAPVGGDKELEYFWRDGWTVTGGVGHSFNDWLSGLVALTWDRGVSTTEDVMTDVYTLAAGVSMKDKMGGEVRLGGALSYLTAGSVGAEAQPTGVGTADPGASFAYSVGGDWSYAFSASYALKW